MKLQRIQFLEKYAALAEDFLSKKLGNKYTPEDVEKLAEAMINMDVNRAAEFERVEEIIKQARYTAKGFAAEIDSSFGEGSFQKISAIKSRSFIKSIRKMTKGKDSFGRKAIDFVDKKERQMRGFIKKDPYMVAGVAGGSLAVGAAGTALID